MRKPWQLKARSIFLLFADGWVSSCPAGEEDSGLAGLARSIAKRESQPMALKPEIRICSGRKNISHHRLPVLSCPVLVVSVEAGHLSGRPSALFGCLVSSVKSCHVASTTQPAQPASQSISIDDQSNPYRQSINETSAN